ncbi:MAG: Flp pilus assembly protein CpaB [Chloroflexi bacterium]|nr:Flp pilus assembly protein CpaB [Chloroflexota bacterium]MBV9598792.1 Flp pilus assembly protein CpaB [Chloroflexota bacterium]
MAVIASPLSPTRAFRPPRYADGRIVFAIGLSAASMLALVLGLRQVLPPQQTVLAASHDLAVGAVITANDVTPVRVNMPDSMLQASIAGDATDQVVGQHLGVAVHAGQVLASTLFAEGHTSVGPGRRQLTVPVEPYTASGGRIGPGDLVTVLAVPRQAGAGTVERAAVVLDGVRVVDVGRADSSGTVLSGGTASTSGTGKLTWVTFDVSVDEAAQLEAAAQSSAHLNLALVGGDGQAR